MNFLWNYMLLFIIIIIDFFNFSLLLVNMNAFLEIFIFFHLFYWNY